MMSPQGGAMASGHDHGDMGSVEMTSSVATPYEAGSAERLDSSEDARAALASVYDAYFDVQMALANDNLEDARKAYGKLEDEIGSVDMGLFEGEGHRRWMKVSTALAEAAGIGESVENIESARDAFYDLSQAAIELHDTFGHTADVPYYLTYCPMARDNKGAYWLQEENIVWNSFYGESMLRCGEIKQEMHADKAMTE